MRFTTLVAFAGVLGGCGHADLKAPCAATGGTLTTGSLAYVEPERSIDRCGRMKPVNVPAPFGALKLGAARGEKPLP